jgi:hypothetical protein
MYNWAHAHAFVQSDVHVHMLNVRRGLSNDSHCSDHDDIAKSNMDTKARFATGNLADHDTAKSDMGTKARLANGCTKISDMGTKAHHDVAQALRKETWRRKSKAGLANGDRHGQDV